MKTIKLKLQGKPGVGKTTLLRQLVKFIRSHDTTVKHNIAKHELTITKYDYIDQP